MAFGLLRSAYIYYETIIGLLSLAMNSLIIYLVLMRTSPSLKQYGFIILLGAFVDLIFCTVNLITVESIDMREGLMFMFNLGPLRNFGSPVPAISSCFWMTSLFLLIINLPMQFYYRYQMLCTGRAIKLVQFGKIYVCVFCYVFLQSCLFSLVYYNRAEETVPYKHILQKNPLYTEDTPRFIVGDTKETATFLHISNTQLIIVVSYTVVCHLSWKIYCTLQKMRSTMTTATIKVQNQLTKLMFIQAVYPLIVFFIPIILTCLCSILQLDLPLLGIGCSYFVALISLANPIAVIWIVPSYKRFILNRLRAKPTNTHNPNTSRMTIFDPVPQLVVLSSDWLKSQF